MRLFQNAARSCSLGKGFLARGFFGEGREGPAGVHGGQSALVFQLGFEFGFGDTLETRSWDAWIELKLRVWKSTTSNWRRGKT